MSTAKTKAVDKPKPVVAELLRYLEQRLLGYPFDREIDRLFVEELVEDFGHQVDLLEETKAFRWYRDGKSLSDLRSARLALRRWLAGARNRRHG